MQVHELKTNAASWDAMRDGRKTADLRLNDRDFHAGDLLAMRRLIAEPEEQRGDFMPEPEYDPEHDPLLMRVTHVEGDPRYGMRAGYVVLSFERVVVRVLR